MVARIASRNAAACKGLRVSRFGSQLMSRYSGRTKVSVFFCMILPNSMVMFHLVDRYLSRGLSQRSNATVQGSHSKVTGCCHLYQFASVMADR